MGKAKSKQDLVLADALAEADLWINTLRELMPTGRRDLPAVQAILAERTFEKEPVLAVTVAQPGEVAPAIRKAIGECVARGDLEPCEETELSDLVRSSARCQWDYYWSCRFECAMHASYKHAETDEEREKWSSELTDQSLLPAFKAGMQSIVNLGSLIIGVMLPVQMHCDDSPERRLHCEDGPALAWPDEDLDPPQYWWRGTRVEKDWIEDTESVDPALCLTEPNAERRRALCEIVGWDRVLEQLKPEVVDTDGDPEIGTLLRVDLPDAPGSQFIQVLCGTKRTFVLPVPEDVRTAIAAQAWMWGLSEADVRLLECRT